MKTLIIFDFDDTMFESESQVIVTSPHRGKRHLTSGEYASYRHEEGDELDFSQFEGYPPNPKPILSVIEKFRNAVRNFGIENVIILTARGNEIPITEVLRDFHLPMVTVAAMGSSDSRMKAEYAARTVIEEKYQSVVLFEDNTRNIVAIRSAVVPLVGEENFHAYRVESSVHGHSVTKH